MAKSITTEFIETIRELSVLELNELVKACGKELGMPVTVGVVVAVVGADAATTEERTEFGVELAEAGPSRVRAIRAVCGAIGLDLREAKDVVDGTPKAVKQGVSREKAGDAKTKLETEDAKVTLK